MKKLDVLEASTTHNAAFVSSIRTYGNLGPFRPENRAEFKGIRLFDLLLRPNQVVCGSTVCENDPNGLLYGNWGVVLGSGDIQQAFPYDAASYVIDDRAVSPYGWRNDYSDLSTQVAHAIRYRSGHNEVDIALNKHSIVGVFFGDQANGADGIDLPSDTVLEMLTLLDIPLYKLQDGRFYRKHPNGTIDASATTINELVDYRFHIPEAVTAHMKQELSTRLLLPPRNAISAGWIHGTIQSREPNATFGKAMSELLSSSDVSHQYFGSMAVFAAQFLPLVDRTAFDINTYAQFVDRITTGNMLRASHEDIEHYLATGTAPAHFGII